MPNLIEGLILQMKNHLVFSDEVLFQSPAIIWRGMSGSQIEKELNSLKRRQNTINRFTELIRANTCEVDDYEEFCDLMLAENVDPILWIDGVVENIDYALEEAIKNANR